MMDPGLITIVIPFYQEENGILLRSVESVLNQSVRKTHQICIIVVDDASPVSAEVELAKITSNEGCHVVLVKQQNGGPASARNRGLDEADTSTKFIAFLDSDDEWIPTHLENAVQALGQDADFYFSDFFQLDQSVTAFSRAGRLDLGNHTLINSSGFLYRYRGDMIKQIIEGNIIGTPTVVFRRSAAPSLRFREGFFRAGEDYFFWIDFFNLSERFVFSSLAEAKCGHGVNIYSGAKWGSVQLLNRIMDELSYRKLCAQELDLKKETMDLLTQKIGTLRIEFAKQVPRAILRNPYETIKGLKKALYIDPICLVVLPINFFRPLH